MKFEEALQFMRTGCIMRRANWRAMIGGFPIVMGWPSGIIEPWRPTLDDIQATDWERVK